jgi:hypothetical protein
MEWVNNYNTLVLRQTDYLNSLALYDIILDVKGAFSPSFDGWGCGGGAVSRNIHHSNNTISSLNF